LREPDAGDLIVSLPGRKGRTEVRLGPARLARLRWLVLGWIGLQVVSLVAVAVLWPRAQATSALVEHNLRLQARLEAVDRQLDEADAMLERLRLYDAELRALVEPRGDHGPIPASAMSNAGVDHLDGIMEHAAADDLDGTIVAPQPGDAPPDGPPAEDWAEDVAKRVASFVSLFELSEPDLNGLVADLETLRAVREALPSAWPAEGLFTSGYGWRRDPYRRGLRFHSGIDIANGYGTPIRAVASGTVSRSTYTSGYGNVVEIDHGFGIITRYAHMSRRRVRVGQRIERSDLLGTMGSTGRSTGPHLHFELIVDGNTQDPMTYLPR